jgi:hypothetical protein
VVTLERYRFVARAANVFCRSLHDRTRASRGVRPQGSPVSRYVSLIALGLLAGCWRASAHSVAPPRPARPAADAAPSYRATTVTADVIGVAAMTAGAISIHRGHDDLGGGLLVAGVITAASVTPVLHLVHGHRARAGGSLMIRSIAATTGMLVGGAIACADARDELLCGLSGLPWGVTGGLAIAGAIDALFLHDRPARTWTPTVTAGDGGARIGVIGSF